MTLSPRTLLFDNWAKHYDASILASQEDFPFAGYEQILDETVRQAKGRPGMRVLDLGIGTGNLAARFLETGCEVWGVDFSAEMLVQANVLDWPEALPQTFDRVVSAYVFHEFDLEAKIRLLHHLAGQVLAPDGVIIIADIAFPDRVAREAAAQYWAKWWDEDEFYWATDEILPGCAGLQVAYRQVSHCGGVFCFSKDTS